MTSRAVPVFRVQLGMPQALETLRDALSRGRYEGTVRDDGMFVLERKIVWAPWKYNGHKDLYLTTGRLAPVGGETEVYASTRPRRQPLQIYALACVLYFSFSMAIGWDKVAQGNILNGTIFAVSLALVFVLPPLFFLWIEGFRRVSFLKNAFKALEGQ